MHVIRSGDGYSQPALAKLALVWRIGTLCEQISAQRYLRCDAQRIIAHTLCFSQDPANTQLNIRCSGGISQAI